MRLLRATDKGTLIKAMAFFSSVGAGISRLIFPSLLSNFLSNGKLCQPILIRDFLPVRRAVPRQIQLFAQGYHILRAVLLTRHAGEGRKKWQNWLAG